MGEHSRRPCDNIFELSCTFAKRKASHALTSVIPKCGEPHVYEEGVNARGLSVDHIANKLVEVHSTIKFQLKKVL